MKFTTGLVLAAVAVAGASADDSKMQTVDTSTLTHVDPATIAGLGPAVPAGNNPKIKKAMEELAGAGSSNYYTVDPKSLPTMDPAHLVGLGPALRPGMPGYGQNAQFNKAWAEYLEKEGKQGRALESTTTSFNLPKDPKTIDPALLTGLGPMTPGNNPKIKQGMEELAGSSDNYNTVDPKSLPTMDPAHLVGLGPALRPGMPGYGQNAQFNKAWAEYLKKEGASTSSSGSAASNCPQVCPDVYQPVCGSDGVTYSNSCFLGVASCNNPEKHITKASDDACSGQAN